MPAKGATHQRKYDYIFPLLVEVEVVVVEAS
jgi:hypothetical protein